MTDLCAARVIPNTKLRGKAILEFCQPLKLAISHTEFPVFFGTFAFEEE